MSFLIGTAFGVALAFFIWKAILGYQFHYQCARCFKDADPRTHPIYHQRCEPYSAHRQDCDCRICILEEAP